MVPGPNPGWTQFFFRALYNMSAAGSTLPDPIQNQYKEFFTQLVALKEDLLKFENLDLDWLVILHTCSLTQFILKFYSSSSLVSKFDTYEISERLSKNQ